MYIKGGCASYTQTYTGIDEKTYTFFSNTSTHVRLLISRQGCSACACTVGQGCRRRHAWYGVIRETPGGRAGTRSVTMGTREPRSQPQILNAPGLTGPEGNKCSERQSRAQQSKQVRNLSSVTVDTSRHRLRHSPPRLRHRRNPQTIPHPMPVRVTSPVVTRERTVRRPCGNYASRRPKTKVLTALATMASSPRQPPPGRYR